MEVNPPRSTMAARRRAAWIQAQKAGELRRRLTPAGLGRAAGALVPPILLAVWVLGLLLRVTVQDGMAGLSAYVYYATPPIVLTGLAIVAGAVWLLAGRRRGAVAALAAGLACAVWAYRATWYHNPPAAPRPNLQRVLFWNIARGAYGWERVVTEIRQHDPDIIGLVESTEEVPLAGRDTPTWIAARNSEVANKEAFWRAHLPAYRCSVSDTGISLLAKREITVREYGQLRAGWCVHFEVATESGLLHVVVTDVMQGSLASRLSPLQNLYRLLDRLSGQPVLVIGDFNTPTDSVLLGPLRRGFANAFEVAGNGYAATWPMPVPVLIIDHAWFNEGVQMNRCELGWSWASDHRPIVMELEVTP